jgi:hypothetical protein
MLGGVGGAFRNLAGALQPQEPSRFQVQGAEGQVLTAPDFPGGETFVPPAPGQAAPPPAPALPTRASVLQSIAEINARKPPVKGAYQTNEDYRRDLQGFENDRARDLTAATQLLGAIPKSEILASNASVTPELNRQKVVGGVARIEGTRAGTENKREQTRSSRLLTPEKVKGEQSKRENIASQIRTRAGQLELGRGRLSETQRHNKVAEELGWMNARTREASAQGLDAYREAMNEKLKFVQDHFDELQIRMDRRAEINALGKVATAQSSIGPLKGSAASAQGGDALKKLDNLLGQIRTERAAGAKPSPSVERTTTTSSSRKTPVQRKSVGGNSFTYDEFAAEGRRRGKSPAQIKQQWGRL